MEHLGGTSSSRGPIVLGNPVAGDKKETRPSTRKGDFKEMRKRAWL
jgi:hypothetical protein